MWDRSSFASPGSPLEVLDCSTKQPSNLDLRNHPLAREGAVDLSIYSIDGRLVRNLARGTLPAGRHALEWDRRDGRGDRVGSGLYIVRLTTNDGRFTRKVSVVQ